MNARDLDPFGPDRDLWIQAKHGTKAEWQLFENDLGKRFTNFLKAKGYDAAKAPALDRPGRAGAGGVPPAGDGMATVLTPAAGEADCFLRLPAAGDDTAKPAGITPPVAWAKSRASSPALW
jgi:hypothetical protein